jgi:hypothetical protein
MLLLPDRRRLLHCLKNAGHCILLVLPGTAFGFCASMLTDNGGAVIALVSALISASQFLLASCFVFLVPSVRFAAWSLRINLCMSRAWRLVAVDVLLRSSNLTRLFDDCCGFVFVAPSTRCCVLTARIRYCLRLAGILDACDILLSNSELGDLFDGC